MDILILIIGIIGFAYAIILHEVSHGLVAERLGDPTARLMGRLTLNPVPHIDLLGTIIVPLIMYFSPLHFIFGWAKPVPVDPYNFKNPKKDLLLVSLAGPLTNLALAIILSIFFRVLALMFPSGALSALFYFLIAINVILAIFNLIPLGPLDGGKVLAGILPDKEARSFSIFLDRFGLILILFLIFPLFGGNSLASIILSPILNFILKILIPGFSTM
jgi:Zn-dependent protease